ncbi:MAG: alpha-galactosidase [Clostridiales bacterium]|nr:alpha-galactosidase [Clostridiales bacterium]
MIYTQNGEFQLNTKTTSYWFRVTKYKHLEHVYYGGRLPDNQEIEPLLVKRVTPMGGTVAYDKDDNTYCLDSLCLEWSGIGKGDYRDTPAEIKMPDETFTADFRYQSHGVRDGCMPMDKLPTAEGQDAQTLVVTMIDESNMVYLDLYYTVFSDADVITRRAVLRNENKHPLTIRRLLSMMLDMPNDGFRMVTFDGTWIAEARRHTRPVTCGLTVNSSTTGDSSNRHNPGFLLVSADARENTGDVYGFNLLYSGNHYGAAELTTRELVRVNLGVNPHCFEWQLKKGEQFETPEAVMSFSENGFNGLSQHFHDFINNHVVRGDWKGKERPVLINSWEACYFNFNRRKLLGLARGAKRLGAELFVLDDGWFGKRDDDTSSLGDYSVNLKKLPNGLKDLAEGIHKKGLKFGLWFEPEMVNPNSDLYRAHPEYAVRIKAKAPALGRNQLVLDLCNPAVRDYIVRQVSEILDACRVDYVKWDYNRHMTDCYSPCVKNQGEFFHRYILGLYDVLARIFRPRPHILLESCSSGGNRFDLGMLCFSPQIWSSDDTDPVERLQIQGGLSCLYPLSAMGAHVSAAPSHQTIRETPLATRFNVAAFGCLGYELDVNALSFAERREVKRQIAFYKRHRRTLQYGRFFRGDTDRENQIAWHCVDDKQAGGVSGFFQTRFDPSAKFDRLRLCGLQPQRRYRVQTVPQSVFIKRFGNLITHALPLRISADGWLFQRINRLYTLKDNVESYRADGRLLRHGVQLNNQFTGTGYNPKLRLLGDYGSNLYTIQAEQETSA